MGWQGYLYVEAHKESHVTDAIKGLRIIRVSKGARLVPLKEMVSAIYVNTQAKSQLGLSRRYHPGLCCQCLDCALLLQANSLKIQSRLCDHTLCGVRDMTLAIYERQQHLKPAVIVQALQISNIVDCMNHHAVPNVSTAFVQAGTNVQAMSS